MSSAITIAVTVTSEQVEFLRQNLGHDWERADGLYKAVADHVRDTITAELALWEHRKQLALRRREPREGEGASVVVYFLPGEVEAILDHFGRPDADDDELHIICEGFARLAVNGEVNTLIRYRYGCEKRKE